MSKTINGIKLNMIQEDTSIAKYRGVVLGTDADEVVAGTDGSVPIIGITDESADSTASNPVAIIITGTAKMTILAATTKGQKIKCTTAGKGALTVTDTEEYVGVLLETTTVANQVAEVALRPGMIAG